MSLEQIVILVLLVICIGLLTKLSALAAVPPKIIFRKPKYMLHPGNITNARGHSEYVGIADLMELYGVEVYNCAMYEEGTKDFQLKKYIHLLPDPVGEYRLTEALQCYLRGELPKNVFSK